MKVSTTAIINISIVGKMSDIGKVDSITANVHLFEFRITQVTTHILFKSFAVGFMA